MFEAQEIYKKVHQDIQNIPMNEFLLSPEEENQLRSKKIEQILSQHLSGADIPLQKRVCDELQSWGPLCSLLDNEEITEILVNGPESIWYERAGRLTQHTDIFFSELSFRNCLDRMCHEARVHATSEHPNADGKFLDFRFSLISSDLTQSHPHFSLRRHPKNPWTFEKLQQSGWCTPDANLYFLKMIEQRKNFLVIGPTGAGKTSVLNSFLNLLPANERVVVIEDTPEIALPNSASTKLLTREDPQGVLPTVDQGLLVKRSLRLRPDRLVMGEVRGSEAKDFLMALATGHGGSFGTLHAQDPAQALIRLEMLIQMGAPQWSLTAIRRLIHLSLEYIVVAGKSSQGQRTLKGIFRVCSLEENGFLLEPVDL